MASSFGLGASAPIRPTCSSSAATVSAVFGVCVPAESKIGIALKEGITSEDAKKISKLIRDEGPKGVKAQIQGDELRVSSKKRDDLQAVQALVKAQDYDFAVQFQNYR